MLPVRRLHLLAPLVLTLASCGSEEGDLPTNAGAPPAAGRDARIRDVADPTSPKAAKHLDTVALSGAVVIAVDTYDETNNGRSKGTIYVQDLGSKEPYSGISLFAPTFVPGNLKVGVGDVLDLRGEFQINQNIGTAVFAPGAVLPQISQPTATFRYEVATRTIEPVDIDIAELASFETGRKWLGMLVRVKNVTLERALGSESLSQAGRLNIDLLPRSADGGSATGCEAPFPKAPTLINQLANVTTLELPKGTTLKSLTGIVSFFCTINIAPRSVQDIEP